VGARAGARLGLLHLPRRDALVVLRRDADDVGRHDVADADLRGPRVLVAEVQGDVAVGDDADDPALAVALDHRDDAAVLRSHDPDRAGEVVIRSARLRVRRHEISGFHGYTSG